MEPFDGEFKAKGVFEVPFAKPGAQLMLNGSGMAARQRSGWVLTAEPPGERATEQVALVVAASPVTAPV